MQIKYQILRYSNFHKKDVRKVFGPILSSILGPTLFLLHINDLPDNVFCNIAIFADDTAIYSKCDKASNLQQQLVSASEIESDQQDTGLGRSGLLISILQTLNWFCLIGIFALVLQMSK